MNLYGIPYPIIKHPRGFLHTETGIDQIKADLLVLLLTNPNERCLTGDTKISLTNGSEIKIKELVGKGEFWVYSYDKDLNSIVAGKATAHKTLENSELLEITLDNQQAVKCTPNHLWLLRSGEYRRADELHIGDSLMPLHRFFNASKYEQLYQPYLHDYKGTHICLISGKRKTGMREVVHHKDLNKHNNDPDNLQWMTCQEHIELHKIISNLFLQKFNNDPMFKENWLQKVKTGLKQYYKTHDGSRKNAVLSKETRKKLSENKKQHYGTQEGTITKELLRKATLKQIKENGHPSLGRQHTDTAKQKMRKSHPSMKGDNNPSKRPEVREKLKLAWEKRRQQSELKNHKIIDIKKLDLKEDCYDLHVEQYHNFALSAGVFVHNCMLPQYGTPLRQLVFEPNDSTLQNQARDMIIKSISTWEPRIVVEAIEVTGYEEDSLNPDDARQDLDYILTIKIKFFDPQNIQAVQTLTLQVPLANSLLDNLGTANLLQPSSMTIEEV